ncbi:MAG TPA: methyltransferase domain-containing protein [Mycobacteriales bacterium]|nr:methyltransferase domain-containing protein [Mycobacteriales bacterium]
MPTRSFRWRGFGVDITVPSRPGVASQLGQPGSLRFAERLPVLAPRLRDARAAVAFRDVAHEEGEHQAQLRGVTGDDELSKRIREISWYHTIELPNGVVTPGQFNHRALVARYGLPHDLAGKRALDVATFDGFWAFELERRGAQVTAIDLDDPRDWDFPDAVRPLVSAARADESIGRGFALAHEALGSSVQRLVRSVYDLDPTEVGTFDFVHAGDLLVHLRDPLRALQSIRSVTKGALLLSDGIDLDARQGKFGPTMQYLGGWDDVVWWVPSLEALAQLLIDAGFRDLRLNAVYNLAKTYETDGFWRASVTALV